MLKLYNKYFLYHLPWQLLFIIIFILSSIPGDRLPEREFNLADKIAHFLLFGLLGLLLARGLAESRNDFWRERYVLWSILIAISYGIIDELHQSFIPGRYTSFSDCIADCLGIVVFVYIYKIWRERKFKITASFWKR